MPITPTSTPRIRLADTEGRRSASWLELFYDLAYVVAVAVLAGRLLVDVTWGAVLSFSGYFGLVWWLWVSHTYYADRYDTDDHAYRLLAAGQMLAVVVVAAALTPGDTGSTRAFAFGYAAARLLMLAMYWRAHRHVPETRTMVGGYLRGFGLAAVVWSAAVVVPDRYRLAAWAVALSIDLATPWVMRKEQAKVPLDVSHLPERFGLFTILVLGEAIASVVGGLGHAGWNLPTVATSAAAIFVATAIWWLYFDNAEGSVVRRRQDVKRSWRPTIWIYTHLPLGASLVAAGVALEDAITHAGSGGMAVGPRWLLVGSVALAFTCMAVLHSASHPMPSASARRLVGSRVVGACVVPLLGLMGGVEAVWVVAGVLAVCAGLLWSDMSSRDESPSAPENLVVTNDPDEGAYVVDIDGERAGKAEYRIRDGRVVFTHTEVEDRFSGRGVASRLARHALDDVRAQGMMIVPLCPFIAAYVRRHDEYQDMVDQEMLDRAFGDRPPAAD